MENQSPSPEGHSEESLTYSETLSHFLRAHIGLGIFAMGDAFKNSGMVAGPILTAILGFSCLASEHMLLGVAEQLRTDLNLPDRPGYAQAAELCFSNGPPSVQKYAHFIRKIVNLFTCITHMGFCCVYLVFISKSLKQICDTHNILHLDLHYHMVIIFIPIFLGCMVRTLKHLAPLSTVANVIMLVGLLMTFTYVCRNVSGITSRKAFASIQQLPLFFGTTIFSFVGIGLVLPLQNGMQQPEKFVNTFGVLNVGMTFVVSLNIFLGFLFYLKYGEEIEGSVTLNLPGKEIFAQAIQILIMAAVLFSFTLQFYVPVSIMFPTIDATFGPFKKPICIEIMFRTMCELLILVLAEAIPFLELFIALIGATSGTTITLLVPPALDIVRHWGAKEITPCMIIKNACIFSLGIIGCLTGTYVSITGILKAFAKEGEILKTTATPKG